MQHVHSHEMSCQSPTSYMNDSVLALNSDKYLKAPVKANITTCNTGTGSDQNQTQWMAAQFDLSEKVVPSNTFDSPSNVKNAKVIQTDSRYQDSTEYTQKKKAF